MIGDEQGMEALVWTRSLRSLTPGARYGKATVTREDVLGCWAASRDPDRPHEDPGPELLWLEASRKGHSDRSLRGDSAGSWAVDVAEMRARLIAQTVRRMRGVSEAVAAAGVDHALSHWEGGRYAGKRFSAEVLAKRAKVRKDVVCRAARIADCVLHSERNEAMSRFCRALAAARLEQ